MRSRIRVVVGIAVVFVLVVAPVVDRSTPTVLACGPFVSYPLFTASGEPDDPRFFEGDLGILQPTYRRAYLLAAWRALAGRPLTKAERLAYAPTTPAPVYPPQPSTRPPIQPISVWLNALRTVQSGGVGNDIRQETFVAPTYSYILNCGDSAFITAASTLQARRAALGPMSLDLSQWVIAQDAVFSNCGRQPNQPPAIPDPLGPEASHAARADRAYQIAAAELYSGSFAEAEAGFAAIARDAESPWRHMAPYLAARAMSRQGTMGGKDAEGDPAALERARLALLAIVADPGLGDLRGSAAGLLRFVRARMEPSTVLGETARALSGPENAEAFASHLQDFQLLMDHVDRIMPREASDDVRASMRESSELIDWIATFQARDDDSLTHALERWDKTRSASWLVAVLAMLPPGHARESEVVAAATAIDDQSPAYPTLAFHRARLLLLAGKRNQSRDVLGQALRAPHLSVSSANLFKAARLLTARTLDEFLQDAVRVPVGVEYNEEGLQAEGGTYAPTFDRDAIDVLNERMSMATLGRIATGRELPASIRRQIVLAVFTRALLLSDEATTRAMLPEVVRSEGGLRAALAPLRSASDDRTLLDEGALVLLAHPGLRPFVPAGNFRKIDARSSIDAFRDNWWCGFAPAKDEMVPYETQYWHRGGGRFSALQLTFRTEPNELAELPFLTDDERRQAAAEWQALQRIDTAPNELGRRAITWVEAHPRDPRAPYVLHLVVRAGHYGCTDQATAAISRQAFERLHRQYSGSTWARQTPFWYR